MHTDIVSLEAWIRDELQNGAEGEEAAEAYAEHLSAFMRPKAQVPTDDDDGGFSMLADDGAGGWVAYGEQMAPRERSGSITGAMAASVGTAVIGGALHVGVATASTTAAATASATATAASYAGSAVVGAVSTYASGGTAAEVAAAALPTTEGLGWAAAGLMGRAASEPVRAVATSAAGAAQHAAISASASATTSAISAAGSTVYSGAAWAAGGAWSLARRRFSVSAIEGCEGSVMSPPPPDLAASTRRRSV